MLIGTINIYLRGKDSEVRAFGCVNNRILEGVLSRC